MEKPVKDSHPVTMDDPAFWDAVDAVVASARMVIDRPAGSSHPRYPNMVYPFDYGYLEGTTAGDGAGIDVWVGSQPGGEVSGIACSVDLIKKDTEIKFLIGCTPADVETILRHMNDSIYMKTVAILRPK